MKARSLANRAQIAAVEQRLKDYGCRGAEVLLLALFVVVLADAARTA